MMLSKSNLEFLLEQLNDYREMHRGYFSEREEGPRICTECHTILPEYDTCIHN